VVIADEWDTKEAPVENSVKYTVSFESVLDQSESLFGLYITNTAPLLSRKIVTDFRQIYFVPHNLLFPTLNHYCGS